MVVRLRGNELIERTQRNRRRGLKAILVSGGHFAQSLATGLQQSGASREGSVHSRVEFGHRRGSALGTMAFPDILKVRTTIDRTQVYSALVAVLLCVVWLGQNQYALGNSSIPGIGADEEQAIQSLVKEVWDGRTGKPREVSPADVSETFEGVLRHLRSDEAKALVWELRADLARQIGDADENMKCCRRIFEEYPGTLRFRHAVNELVDGYQQAGDYAAMAEVASVAAQGAKETDRRIHLTGKIAIALVALGKSKESVDILFEQLEAHPEHDALINNILNDVAVSAFSKGDYEVAKTAMDSVYRQMPRDKRSLTLLGNAAMVSQMAGRPEDAIRLHKEAVSRYPDDVHRAQHEFEIALLLFEKGDLKLAREYYQAVVASKKRFDGIDILKKLAESNIEIIDRRTGGARLAVKHSSSTGVGPRRWAWLAGGNICAALSVFLWAAFRRKSRRGGTE